MKSQKVKKLLKQISEILSDVDINDHRGQPTSNEELNVFVDKNSLRDLTSVKNDIVNIFDEYFKQNNLKLGQILSLKDLNQKILNVDGVVSINTSRVYDNKTVQTDGISFLIYNPVYPTSDFNFTEQDIPLLFFQYPYFKDLQNISDKIVVTRQG